jgi:DNA-binding transcriptional LysR family regulator
LIRSNTVLFARPSPLGETLRSGPLEKGFAVTMNFDLIDIRLFVNVAKTQSLTRGAECSFMSLPAASVRIKAMEGRLGTKLLYRTSHGVTLTPAGQAFHHHGLTILHQLEHLERDLREYAEGVKGHVRVYANTTSITEFLPSVLRKYLLTHPDINVDLQEHLSPEIVRALTEEVADIGIIAGNVETSGLQVMPYRRDRMVVVTAPSHPLADRSEICFLEALDYEYVGMVPGSASNAFMSQAAYALNRPLNIRIHVGNFEALCSMVSTNVGIGMLPNSAAQRYARTMDFRIIPLTDTWAVRDIRICVRSLEKLPAFARDLVDLLISDCTSTENELAAPDSSFDSAAS